MYLKVPIKVLLPGRILAGILEKRFFLGGIPASTDFSAGFLPRYAAGIFPGKDPAGKTGHLSGGIPVSAGNLDGIPARSRYLFYKGSFFHYKVTLVQREKLYIHYSRSSSQEAGGGRNLHMKGVGMLVILVSLRVF